MTQPLGMLRGSATGRASGLRGTGMKQISIPTMTHGQQTLFEQLLRGTSSGAEGGLSQLSKLAIGGPESYEAYDKPALRQFGAMQGNIASRFSGMGTGARKSSGFQSELGEQGASLAEQLASRRMDMQRQAISELLGLSSSLLGQRTQENILMPKQEKHGFLKQLALGAVGGLGTAGKIGLQAMLGG